MRLIALVSLLAVATPALAADTPFSSGVLFYSNVPGDVDTLCFIYNAGTKPVTITSVGLLPAPSDVTGTLAKSGDCLTAPLAPDTSCSWGGTRHTIYGGGVARVRGSTKNLRGTCSLINHGSSVELVNEPLR
jgi:hypothetical protein